MFSNRLFFLKDSNIILLPIFVETCRNFFLYNGKKYIKINLDKNKFFFKLNLFIISKRLGIMIHHKKKKNDR